MHSYKCHFLKSLLMSKHEIYHIYSEFLIDFKYQLKNEVQCMKSVKSIYRYEIAERLKKRGKVCETETEKLFQISMRTR